MKNLVLATVALMMMSVSALAQDGNKSAKKCDKPCDVKECQKDAKKCNPNNCTDKNCPKDKKACAAYCKAQQENKETK